jgi:hypothetical protein
MLFDNGDDRNGKINEDLICGCLAFLFSQGDGKITKRFDL